MIKKFKLWESLYEAKQSKESIINKVNGVIKDLYHVPDFQEIQRPDEPEQIVDLFSDHDGHSFALNFTEDDMLYSIDFWLPNSTKPESTLYLKGENVDAIIKNLPKLIKDPKPGDKELKEAVTGFFNPANADGSSSHKSNAKEPSNEVTLKKPAKTVEKSTDPKVDAMDKDISDYKFGDPDTIFDDFRKYLKLVIDGTQPALLVTGSAGVGKSFITADELRKAGLEKGKDWIKVKGKTTAAALYISLYRNNGKLLIYDDCDSIFKDENAVNVLKGALDTEESERDITWDSAKEIKDPSTGEVIPKSFNFKGRVIFLSNLPQKKIDPAIKSRAFVLEVALSPEDMVKYIEKLLPKVLPEEPMVIKKGAFNTIKNVASNNKNVQLNMRTVSKAIKILKAVDDLATAKRMIMQQSTYDN